MAAMRLKDLVSRADVSESIAIEGAKLDFALSLSEIMEREGLKKVDLAERLGVSRPMVTKILRGNSNLTIETMVRASVAVSGKLQIRVVPESSTGHWIEVIREKPCLGSRKARVRKLYDPSIAWEQVRNNGTEPVAA
jgi:transcriptional regulator with XRE-family HTH domain